MEHRYIEDQNIADRYLMRQLSAEEQRLFEEHFLDCRQCRDLLETGYHFRKGLLSASAAEAESGACLRSDTGGLTSRIYRKFKLAWQCSAALLIALLMAGLFLAWKWARSDLAQAREAAAEWHRKYDDERRAQINLRLELQARDRQITSKHDQVAPQIEGERRTGLLQVGSGNHRSHSQDAVSVFALSMARGGDSGDSPSLVPTNRVILSPRAELVIFLLELEMVADPEIKSYRATILNSQNQKIWQISNLKPGSNNMLILNFESKLLNPGHNYLLNLEELVAQKKYMAIAQYTFIVLSR